MEGGAISGRSRAILAAIIAVLALVAYHQRWLQDDAFITFRYSRNLADGIGPGWNAGPPVEGYTNFLWMVLGAGLHWAGLSAPTASHVLSLPCFVLSLWLVFRIGRLLLASEPWALLATALVGTNYSFLMYATGGLETELNVSLTLAALLITAHTVERATLSVASALLLSLTVALAIMTRPDSLILALVAFGFTATVVLRQWDSVGRRAARLALLGAPAFFLLSAWLAWKHAIYGDIVPNTFYIKLGIYRPATMTRGLIYVLWPFVTFGWLPVALFLLVRARGRLRLPAQRALYPLLAYTLLWLAYAIRIGGDIMEFRQLICVFPLIIVMLVRAWSAVLPDLRSAAALGTILTCTSAVHAQFFPRYVHPAGIGNVPTLASAVTAWSAMGERLRADLGADSGVTIAVAPAGAIPYYSQLRSIDILGLNDRWVARHGYVRRGCDVCLGHLRLATFEYMNGEGVHLVLGHPQLIDPDKPASDAPQVVRRMFYGETIDYERVPDRAQLLRIPTEGGRAFAALYMRPNARVDALIASQVWKAQPFTQVATASVIPNAR